MSDESNKRPKLDGGGGDGEEATRSTTPGGFASAGPPTILLSADATVNEVPYENQTILYKLIGSKAFVEAEERLGTHPEEAKVWIVTRWIGSGSAGGKKGGTAGASKEARGAAVEGGGGRTTDGDREGKEGDDKAKAAAGAGTTEWYRRLPLHHIAERAKQSPTRTQSPNSNNEESSADSAIISLVQSLIGVHPAALTAKDELGRVPLVHACIRGASLSVVRELLGRDGEGEEDGGGSEGGGRDGEDAAARTAAAAAAAVPDNDSRLPLHWVTEYSSSPTIIQTVLNAHPPAVRHLDVYGRTPLHWECLNLTGENASVVTELIEAHPDGVTVQDLDGKTPLDLAGMNLAASGVGGEEAMKVLREAMMGGGGGRGGKIGTDA